MPIYEYICKECGEQFEKLTSLASAHRTQECPECGKASGERIMSASSLSSSGHDSGAGPSCGPAGFG